MKPPWFSFVRSLKTAPRNSARSRPVSSCRRYIIPGLPEGLSAEWIHPAGSADSPSASDKAIFYTHGGGYVSRQLCRSPHACGEIRAAAGVGALLYDYRLAPEHPFPAAMEDTLTAYRWLVDQGVAPANIVIVGESAGGGLCLASLLAIRDSGLPLPAAGVALSPWTDLKRTGNSYQTNAMRDISTLGSWDVWSDYYVGTNDPSNPWISPLYGDLHGLPPILIEVGDHEILLDDSLSFRTEGQRRRGGYHPPCLGGNGALFPAAGADVPRGDPGLG